MRIPSTQLLYELEADVRSLLVQAHKLTALDNTLLTRQPSTGRWSVAQVLWHLNSYGHYYLPAVRSSLGKSNHPSAYWFRPGWLGNYFTKLMKPGTKAGARKMKAPVNHRPSSITDAAKQIHEFISQQQELLQLLDIAREKNIGKTRVPISIAKWIRLKSGDTFRFLVAHQQRHFQQIDRTLVELKKQEGTDDVVAFKSSSKVNIEQAFG